MTTARALAGAAQLGRDAGQRFRREGIPSPNPFQRRRPGRLAELARAWRRAYFAELRR